MSKREEVIGVGALAAAEASGIVDNMIPEEAARLARFVLHADVLTGEPLFRWAVSEGIFGDAVLPWRGQSEEARLFWNIFVAVVNALDPLFPEEKSEAETAPLVVSNRPRRVDETIFTRDGRAGDSSYPEAARRGETTTAGISVRQEEPPLPAAPPPPKFSVYNMGAPGVVEPTPRGERFDPAAFLAQARQEFAEGFEAAGLDPATAALRAEAMTSGPAAQRLVIESAPPPASREPDYDETQAVEVDATAKLEPGDKGPAKGRFVVKRKAGA